MKIVWTEPAVADLTALRDYIARDSEHYARQLIARILQAVEHLESLPRMGRQVPGGAPGRPGRPLGSGPRRHAELDAATRRWLRRRLLLTDEGRLSIPVLGAWLRAEEAE